MQTVSIQLEHVHDTFLLAGSGPADEHDFLQPLELNGSVDREVGARARRQLSLEKDVDQHRAVLDRGINPGDLAFDNPIASINRSRKTQPDVFRLRLGDANL